MIAMPLTYPDFSEPPGSKRSTVPTVFQPLDPSVLNASIPAFFIGRDKDGFWLARDASGRTGGIFLLESSALAFAQRNSRPSGCATIFPSQPFELDVENQGNPLIPRLRPLIRLAALARHKFAQAVERRLKRFHIL
jgi:hypothetical protein